MGVDDTFEGELAELSTAWGSQSTVRFLGDLGGFVRSQQSEHLDWTADFGQ